MSIRGIEKYNNVLKDIRMQVSEMPNGAEAFILKVFQDTDLQDEIWRSEVDFRSDVYIPYDLLDVHYSLMDYIYSFDDFAKISFQDNNIKAAQQIFSLFENVEEKLLSVAKKAFSAEKGDFYER